MNGQETTTLVMSHNLKPLQEFIFFTACVYIFLYMNFDTHVYPYICQWGMRQKTGGTEGMNSKNNCTICVFHDMTGQLSDD